MKENIIKPKVIKLGFLGAQNVGKTVICNQYLGLGFSSDFLTTIGQNKLDTKYKLQNGEEIKLILWDTSGAERFISSNLTAIRMVQGIILVFDVTFKSSLNFLDMMINGIKERLNNPILVLFANKVDIDKSMWNVSIEEMHQFAEKNKIPLFETSAKTGKGIMEGLSYIVNEIHDKKSLEINNNIMINKRPSRRTNDDSVCIINKKIREYNNNKKNNV